DGGGVVRGAGLIAGSRVPDMSPEVQRVFDELKRFIAHLRGTHDPNARIKAWYNGVAFEIMGNYISFTSNKLQPIQLHRGNGWSAGMICLSDLRYLFSRFSYDATDGFWELEAWFDKKEKALDDYI